MNSIKISVIIPVYNVEKYIEKCLKSVLAQNYSNLEIILVDDGSTDSSGKLCDRYQELYSDLKVIHRENGGLAAARNSGLKCASGDYITFVDSDDFLEPDAYNRLSEFIFGEDCDICYFGHYRENESKIIKYDIVPSKRIYSSKEEILGKFLAGALKGKNCGTGESFTGISVWCALYKRMLLFENEITFRSEREILSEDIIFNLEACIHANKVSIYPDYLYHYVFREQSLTKDYRKDRFEAALRMDTLLHSIANDNNLEALLYDGIRNCFVTNLIVCLKQEVIFEKINGHKMTMERLKSIGTNETTVKYIEDSKTTGDRRQFLIDMVHKKRWNLVYLCIKGYMQFVAINERLNTK